MVDVIVEVIIWILFEKGWNGLNINVIVKCVGVFVGLVYEYFFNK